MKSALTVLLLCFTLSAFGNEDEINREAFVALRKNYLFLGVCKVEATDFNGARHALLRPVEIFVKVEKMPQAVFLRGQKLLERHEGGYVFFAQEKGEGEDPGGSFFIPIGKDRKGKADEKIEFREGFHLTLKDLRRMRIK